MKYAYKQVSPRYKMDRVSRFIRDLSDTAEEVGLDSWLPALYRLEKIADHKRAEITMMIRPLADENLHITIDNGSESGVLSISTSNATNMLYSSYVALAFENEFMALDRSTDESPLTEKFLDRIEGYIEYLDSGCSVFPDDDYLYISSKYLKDDGQSFMQSLARFTRGQGGQERSPMYSAINSVMSSTSIYHLDDYERFIGEGYRDIDKAQLAKLFCLKDGGWLPGSADGNFLMNILTPALGQIELTPLDVKSADILKHSNLIKIPAVLDAFLGDNETERAGQFLSILSKVGLEKQDVPESVMAKINRCLIQKDNAFESSRGQRKIKI